MDQAQIEKISNDAWHAVFKGDNHAEADAAAQKAVEAAVVQTRASVVTAPKSGLRVTAAPFMGKQKWVPPVGQPVAAPVPQATFEPLEDRPELSEEAVKAASKEAGDESGDESESDTEDAKPKGISAVTLKGNFEEFNAERALVQPGRIELDARVAAYGGRPMMHQDELRTLDDDGSEDWIPPPAPSTLRVAIAPPAEAPKVVAAPAPAAAAAPVKETPEQMMRRRLAERRAALGK